MIVKMAKELEVYKLAYRVSMDIYHISKSWPADERYALTDQCRRSSRSVCANLREAWSKRKYHAHFMSKLTDCDGENSETDTWIDYAHDCGYISKEQHHHLTDQIRQVGSMIGGMMKNPNHSS